MTNVLLNTDVADGDVFPNGAAYVDGKLVRIEDANISMLDWGFLHSDATYDVVHVWNGKFFRLEDHLDRFERGMQRLRMNIGYDRAGIATILRSCVRAAQLDNAYVEMICTRGVPPPGARDPRLCTNRFFAFAVPFTWIATPEQRRDGLRLRISDVQRIAPQSIDPTVKNYHWLDLVRGLYDAYDQGDETVVLTDAQGGVVEGPGFNIFALIDGTLVTPSSGVLAGVTRLTAIEMAHKLEIPVEVRVLTANELRGAQEVFITSTAGGVMPVSWVDGRAVGVKGMGRQTARISEAYWTLHDDPSYSSPI